MKLNEVQSSNIARIGYDRDSKLLEVHFKNGGVYHYEGVDEAMHQRFLQAESKGKFFGTHIRDHYKFKRHK